MQGKELDLEAFLEYVCCIADIHLRKEGIHRCRESRKCVHRQRCEVGIRNLGKCNREDRRRKDEVRPCGLRLNSYVLK
jgi:hypothetical protein